MIYRESLYQYPMIHAAAVAFSTTRHGGCGRGAYGTFNCTPYTGDEPTVVLAHQDQLCRDLGIPTGHLVIPYQTHSCNVLSIDESFMQLSSDARHALLQEKDAIITSLSNVCLCISTADCVPVLLHDPVRGVVAAAHAGWRGTVGHIVAKTLQAMQETYGTCPSDVYAIIGPCISLAAFEVGIEVYDAFADAGFPMDKISQWYPEKEKYHLNLPMANRLQLIEAGVSPEAIHDCGICTYTNHRDFFSARRLGIKSGRILNGIVLK